MRRSLRPAPARPTDARPASRRGRARCRARGGLAAAATITIMLTTACGTSQQEVAATAGRSSAGVPTVSATPHESPSGGVGQTTPYAFSAVNCGHRVERTSAPERIVTVKSAMTNLVLALGAGESLVGVAYQDGDVDPTDPVTNGSVATGEVSDVVGIMSGVPVLAERMPTREGVLATAPDLVLAGWESAFAADAAGEPAGYDALGITAFVAPAACVTDPPPGPLTWEDVFGEVTVVGALLGREAEAAALVAHEEARLMQAEGRARALLSDGDGETSRMPTTLWWSSASDTPYVGAGDGAPQLIMETVGLENIAADLSGGWSSYSWEAAAWADPDYLVLVDASWSSAEKKKAFLASNPVTAAMRAVQEERYLVVPFADTEAGVGNIDAVELLLDQLAEAEGARA